MGQPLGAVARIGTWGPAFIGLTRDQLDGQVADGLIREPHAMETTPAILVVFLTLSLPAMAAHAQAPSPISGVPPELLEDLALGSRILAEFGVVDAFGHVSARSPADPGTS